MNSIANFPAGSPLDPQGRLTPEWRMFFLVLFNRGGGGEGVDVAALQKQVNEQGNEITDLQTEVGAGAPSADLAPVYALIYAVEAIAAQAVAAANCVPDERGESGESSSSASLLSRINELEQTIENYRSDDALRQRIADLEGKVDALAGAALPSTQDIEAQLSEGRIFIIDASQMSGFGSMALQAASSVAITGGTIDGTAIGTTTRSTAKVTTLNANGTVTLDGAGPRIDFNTGGPNVRVATTNVLALSNGLADVIRLSASSNALIATSTDDGSGNKLQVNGGVSIAPSTTTTAPAAGGAGALPATPTGYATIRINGTDRKVAYY
ncbi:hypothetical protein POK33_09020 [Burkholderia cenocepacia]|uniref:hypothetical protein n=1 Tax=Burkholderia cenocepacia TaxID=95486 RepID=UPI0023B89648|nr:hypothetical protein [Burkholderia cenocepacia]MDF0500871.1 hypothetical protein [Burkholderia cenocepacia]